MENIKKDNQIYKVQLFIFIRKLIPIAFSGIITTKTIIVFVYYVF